MTVHLLDDQGDSLRIVVEGRRSGRRLFEAVIPKDATEGELVAFGAELARILKKRLGAAGDDGVDP